MFRNAAETTETQLHVEWGQLTTQAEMGGVTCSILSYNLEWDQGTGVWQELTGIYSLYTSSEHIVHERVSSGNYYKLRVRAKNKHGWGGYSDEITVLAAVRPDASTETKSIQNLLIS